MNPHAPWYRYWERPFAQNGEGPADEPARERGPQPAADAPPAPPADGAATPASPRPDADVATAGDVGPRHVGPVAGEQAPAGQAAQPDPAGADVVPTSADVGSTGAGDGPGEGHGLASDVAAEPYRQRGDRDGDGDGDHGVPDAPAGGSGDAGSASATAEVAQDPAFHVEPQDPAFHVEPQAPVFHVEPQAPVAAAGGDPGAPAAFHVEPPAPAAGGDPGEPVGEAAFHVERQDAEAGPGAPTQPAPLPIEPDALGLAARPPHVDTPPGDDDAASEVQRPARAGQVAPGSHFARARVLTIANQKGGVGKTTTAVSVSAALADLGCRVLLVDLDPQGNATSGVGVRVPPDRPTIYDVLVGDVDLEDAIEPTSVRNLFVVPSNLDLAGAEIELVSAFNREQKLRRALEPIRAEYDIVLIDCPPSLGLLTVNALSAGDGLVVPIQCEYYALEGLGALRRNADLIRSQLNPDLDITGFVLTMLDARTRLSQQVVDEVRAHFGNRVFTTRIPRSVRLAEAPGFGQPITVFDPASRGALAYRRLAAELLDRLMTNDGPPPPERRTEGAPV